MKRLTWFAALAVLVLSTGPVGAAPRPYAGAQFRYWSFSNDNDLRDYIAYWVPGPFHVQLEFWDFVYGDDQFRPEAGVHLRDRRGSVYSATLRLEGSDQARLYLQTDQLLTDHVVGRVGVSPIFHDGSATQTVLYAGADYYWGSYNFASANIIRDPRNGGLWVYPCSVRLANERNDWVQATLAPASERTLGWALDGKIRWLRLGVERNSRYDFTDVDNLIFTVGVEFPLRPEP